MIEWARGDLFEADVDALVNAVNTAGVMGKGIALAFKQRFPDYFAAYAAACARGEVQIGRVRAWAHPAGRPAWILDVPTKRHWRSRSRLDEVAAGIDALVEALRARSIASVAVPALGCGLGGLAWADVRPHLERAFARAPEIRALVFAPA